MNDLSNTRASESKNVFYAIARFAFLVVLGWLFVSAAPMSPAQNTGLMMNSPNGEPIGDGYYYYYTPGDGDFRAEKNYRNGVTISFTSADLPWTLFFAAPGKALLTSGTFEGAVAFGDQSENSPQMAVSGNGRGSNSLTGRFVIKEIVYGSGNTIAAFHATFSQTVGSPPNSPALTGEILFQASAPLPADESALHPPEEILYEADSDGGAAFRPNGVSMTSTGWAGSKALAFDRRGCLYVGGWTGPPSGNETVSGFVWKTTRTNRSSPVQIPGFERSRVTALACDKGDNIWVAEADPAPKVTKVGAAGERTAWSSGFRVPSALAFDGAGNLYVADNGTHALSKITPTGDISVVFEGLPDISAMAFDSEDNLLVAEPGVRIILKITPQGSTVVASGFKEPRSIAIDKAGTVFVGDYDPRWDLQESGGYRYFGGRIYKCASDGTKTQFASTSGRPNDLDFAPHPLVVPMNISTRAAVGTGQNVLIGGFIVVGGGPKKIVVRGVGPSLTKFGIGNPLSDPVLQLYDSAGNAVASNDNWRDTQTNDIAWSGFAPENDFESAIISTLSEGAYTAVLAGRNETAGVGLLEIYDLDTTALARLANISTRCLVQASDSVLIGGFVLGAGIRDSSVVVRALGPSLTGAGIAACLEDPVLELRERNGALVRSNDNWRESQEAELEATGIAPTDNREAAIAATLSAGHYTAIVRGQGGAVGVGIVEVYHLESN